jgi:type IV fimbrial biogenesis protein FimT
MKRQNGFSLIELIVTVAILGMLLALGLPSFSLYLANAKLRSSAEVFMSGLQTTRNEAVKRNTTVELVLTDDDVEEANAASVTPLTTGRNWLIRLTDPLVLNRFIEAKSGSEGSGGAVAVQVDGGGVTAVVFNGLGNTTLATSATFQFTNAEAGNCQSDTGDPGPVRCLNVMVSPGGQVRMCDPASTNINDPRRCSNLN